MKQPDPGSKITLVLSLFSNIRFWIVLYFVIRLFHITQPPLEAAHNWRQSTGLMVSRNFYELDANIFYPRLDFAGEKTGITGTEFPLFNYLVYLFARVFGWADWYGRLTNLIISSFGILWFYKILARYFSPRMAFYASLVLLNSLWFAYSRKTMPDTFSVALVLGGLYSALEYLSNGNRGQLFLFAILAFCGIMSKIPAGYLLVVLVLPFLKAETPLVRKAWVAALGVVVMIPVVWWYFIWVPYLVQEFGLYHYYMGTTITNGMREIATHLDETVQRFSYHALNYVGFSLCVAGAVWAAIRRQKIILLVSFVCFATFAVFVLKAGYAFYHHNYYVIPFVPVMAMLAGYMLSEIKIPALRNLGAVAIACEVILNAVPEFRTNNDQKYKLTLEPLVAKHTCTNDLIAINCGPNPQQIYLSHRKGWNLKGSSQITSTYIESIRSRGCKMLVINKHESYAPALPYEIIEEGDDFIMYKL